MSPVATPQNQRVESLHGPIVKHRKLQLRGPINALEEKSKIVLGPVGIAAGAALNSQTGVYMDLRAAVRIDQLDRDRSFPRRTFPP